MPTQTVDMKTKSQADLPLATLSERVVVLEKLVADLLGWKVVHDEEVTQPSTKVSCCSKKLKSAKL